VIKIWENLIRFGQNQNLESPKTLDLPTAIETLLKYCKVDFWKSMVHYYISQSVTR